MTDLEVAKNVATLAHLGQKDTVTGEPYRLHVERVAGLVEGDDAKTVAWLHDVIEDSKITAEDLRHVYKLPERIVSAVVLLTRTPPYDYAEYIARLQASGDPLAIAVKLADLRDHLTPHCSGRLRPRYERALAILEPFEATA